MQAFVPRLYLTPVRDEEAESQRKAKSRHARQTRRSTQGVTLTDLKEAQKTNSLSPQESRMEEIDKCCVRKGLTDETRVQISLTGTTETTEISSRSSKLDKQGNIEPRLETLIESPLPNLSYSSLAGSCGLPYCNNSLRAGKRWWTDENQNPVEDPEQTTFATKQQQRRHCCDVEGPVYNSAEKAKYASKAAKL